MTQSRVQKFEKGGRGGGGEYKKFRAPKINETMDFQTKNVGIMPNFNSKNFYTFQTLWVKRDGATSPLPTCL